MTLSDDPLVLHERIRELEDTVHSLQSITKAWWDIRSLNDAELSPLINDSIRGYLRTCRSGGMPERQAKAVESVLEGATSTITATVWPVILGLAHRHRNDLVVPDALSPPPTPSNDRIEALLKTAIEDPALKGSNSYVAVLMALNYLHERNITAE